MSDRSRISWCDATWSPVRGCSLVSASCKNCYAARQASRFADPGQPYEGLARYGKWTGEVRVVPEALELPLRWRKPRRIFVNSMSDLFHERLSEGYIATVFGVMALAPRHTFVVLTKRAARMRAWFAWCATAGLAARAWPLPNVILGVSVEDQATADERIPDLLATPAARRVVSYEPALAEVSFVSWLYPQPCDFHDGTLGDGYDPACPACRPPLSWLVCGGESGPGARPCDVEWISATACACRDAGVSCFVKQDSGPRPGQQGRIPDDLWRLKEIPHA